MLPSQGFDMMHAPSKKLSAKQLGPYTITKLIGPSSYCLDIPATWRVHNAFHAGLLSHTKDDTIPGWTPNPMSTVRIKEKELWVINCFINSHWSHGKFLSGF
jgi:hypothetical protein